MLLGKIEGAADKMTLCNNSVQNIYKNLKELRKDVKQVQLMLTKVQRIVTNLARVVDRINKPIPQGLGIADKLAKIPKYGIFIKIGLQAAHKILLIIGKVVKMINKAVKRITNAIKSTENVFKKVGKVSKPITKLLTKAEDMLSAAQADARVSKYCNGNAAGLMEDANTKAYALVADPLEKTRSAGNTCHTTLTPVENALNTITKAATALSQVMAPVDTVVTAVDNFIADLDKRATDMYNYLKNNAVVGCLTEVFEPITDILNVAMCPLGEMMEATMRFVVEPMFAAVGERIDKLVDNAIRAGVDAIIPDNLHFTIPKFHQHLPTQSWIAVSSTANTLYSASYNAAVHEADMAGLPYTVSAGALEAAIIAEATPELSGDKPGQYESICAQAVKDIGSDYPSSCVDLVTQFHDAACASATHLKQANDQAVATAQQTVNNLQNTFNNANHELTKARNGVNNAKAEVNRATNEVNKFSCHIRHCTCRKCWWHEAACHAEALWCCPIIETEKLCEAGKNAANGVLNTANHALNGANAVFAAAQKAATAAANELNKAKGPLQQYKNKVAGLTDDLANSCAKRAPNWMQQRRGL